MIYCMTLKLLSRAIYILTHEIFSNMGSRKQESLITHYNIVWINLVVPLYIYYQNKT